MDEDGFLSASRVAVWGLGLMGGSLALALKGKCRDVVGIDPDPAVVELARAQAVVSAADTRPQALLPGADVVILAAPVQAIIALLAELPTVHPGSSVVLDLGSTKRQILAAMEALPSQFDPLGGHPMCGKEKSSLRYAEAAIYQNAPFALVPLERTTARARALGEELARAVGACPLWLDAAQHDRWVAATSHVPYLLASALALATPAEAAPMLGTGFRSTARLAGSSAEVMIDILKTNPDHIRAALKRVRAELEQIDRLLAGEDYENGENIAELKEQLEAARAAYSRLVE